MNSITTQNVNHFYSVLKLGTLSLMIPTLVSLTVYWITLVIPPLQDVLYFFQKYLFSDWEALTYVSVAVFVDTVTGMYAAWRVSRKGQGPPLSSSAFARLGDKMLVYGSLFVLGHVLYSFTVKGEDITLLHNFNLAAVMFMLLRETWSIIENFTKLGIKLPSWLTNIVKIKSLDPKKNRNSEQKKEN